MSKTILITFIAVFSSLIVESSSAQFADLNASTDGNQVKLIWTTNDWPRELMGFNLKKREVGQDEWQLMNAAPITPEILVDKDWNNLGLNQQQEEQIRTKLASYLEDGKLAENSKEDLLLLFRQTGGIKSGDRIKIKKDFDMALMLSFGYIDNEYQEGDNFEYGLFSVSLNGVENPEPIDTYSLADEEFTVNVTFERPAEGINLKIAAPKEKASKSGLWGFNIYKVVNDEATLMDKVGYATFQESNGTLHWVCPDGSSDNSQDQTYRIAPVNSLQKETQQITAIYEADLYEAIPLPEIVDVSLVEEINVKISWKAELSRKQRDRISNIIIQRLGPDDDDFVVIDSISGQSVEFTDQGLKKYDRIYTYQVGIVDTKGNVWYSQQASISYQGKLLPKQPSNLQGSVEREGLTNFIRLSWNRIPLEDSVTFGYYVYTDEQQEGTMIIESMPVIKGNTYRHKVFGPEGRNYTFRVVPINENLDQGAFAEVKVFLGDSRLPEVQAFQMETLPDNSIRLSWEYPEATDMLGFKVLMNGEPLGEGDTLSMDQKSFIVNNPVAVDNDMARFQVMAIGEYGVARSPERSMLVSERKAENAIPPPTGLEVKLTKQKGKHFAELSWDEVDLTALGIRAYILFADATTEGDIQRQSDIDLIKENKYLFELPDKKRQKYTFRLAVMAQDRSVASFAEITLDKSKKQKSEDK